MTTNKSLANQTKAAFDFLQKFYLEVSYLIKEVEGLLNEEPEKFIIGRPGGYGISQAGSSSLDAMNINNWLLQKFAVFFISEQLTKIKGGKSITKLNDDLKLIYLRFILNDPSIAEPLVYCGALYDIEKINKDEKKWPTKFELLMGHFEKHDKKVFAKSENINYKDAYIKLRGKLIRNELYKINDSSAVVKKIIEPTLKIYRKVNPQ